MTTAASTTTTEATTTTSTTVVGVETAVDTAAGWTTAIADGGTSAAIALTSQRSLDAVGGEEGFRRMDIELAEGWGAWGRTDDKTVTSVALPDLDDAELAVFHGEVSQEGPPEESWAALPVVATTDGDRVEPFLDLGEVAMSPDNGAVVEPDESFEPTTPDGLRSLFVIDDGEAMTLDELGSHAPLEPGLHALTVVVWNADGVMARSFLYTVNG